MYPQDHQNPHDDAQDDGIEQLHRDLQAHQTAINEILSECIHLPDGSWAIPDGGGLRLCPKPLCRALNHALKASVYHSKPLVNFGKPRQGGET